MTVIRPNSVSGITSITAQANEINFFRSNGTLAGLQLNGVNFNTTTGVSTFNNLDVGGVLTYQDVTNVDSVGIITARSTIDAQGDVSIADKIIHTGDTNTAIRFPANDTISFETSGTEKLRIASNGAVSINYAGTGDNTLHIGNTSDAGGIIIKSPGNHYANMVIDSNRSGANNGIFNLAGKWNGNDVAYISFTTGTDTTNKDDGYIRMYTRESGQSLTENVRITSSGVLKLTGQSSSFETAGITHHTNNNLYIRGGTTGAVLQSVDGNESWIVQNDYVSASTSGQERLRIVSNGKVNIGGQYTQTVHSLSANSSNGSCVIIGNTSGTGSGSHDAQIVASHGSDFDNLKLTGHAVKVFTNHPSGLTETMGIDRNGYVTTPYQPSFRAGLSGNTTVSTGSYIVFNDTGSTWHHNIGNHYNTSNGRFTAPKDGVYTFNACVIYGPFGGTNNVFMGDAFLFYVNGGNAGYSGRRGYYISGDSGNNYYTDHMSITLKLNYTDYIQIRNGSSFTGIHGNTYYTWFAGTLLG